MANYAVTDLTTATDSLEAVAAALEALLEGITDTKTIYYIDILRLEDQQKFQGIVIHQA